MVVVKSLAVSARKDNVDLVCNIAERVGLFEKSAHLEDVLQAVVSTVAWHMKTAVCSIYLLDSTGQELVLRATQGLREDAIGQVRLKIGEGVSGLALKELRPISIGRGASSPVYKAVPGIDEEKYEAILAVPILRGLQRIGALVVQDTQPDYFDENDAKALRAIAAQLAPAIDDAGLLLRMGRLEESEDKGAVDQEEELSVIRGSVAAKGIASGTVALVDRSFEAVLERFEGEHDVSLEQFKTALRHTEEQIEAVQIQLEEHHADIASLIFSAHLLILKDPSFSEEMIKLAEQGTPVVEAVLQVLNRYTALFAESSNARLREKVHDLNDLGHRLLQNLFLEEETDADYHGEIVVAHELLPSDIVKLAAQRAEGIILTGSAAASHVAILATSLGLPMVVVEKSTAHCFHEGRPLILDAGVGNVFIDPDDSIRERYQPLLEAQTAMPEPAREVTHTSDGARVILLANVNLLSDLDRARQLNAEGVGLYRSEFPFIIRNDFPSEEEQYQIYRHLVEDMPGKEIVFRTLDTGGDKMLSYFPQPEEDNPFLGLRAIRFSLRHKDLFSQQLRAILRAGEDANLKIMFPLVASVDDFLDARSVVEECLGELEANKIPHCTSPRLGAMVELPSAVEIAPELARETDFLCIGTNDLTQYMLAVDRTNEEVSYLYREHHPAVLRAMKRITAAAESEQTEISLCGQVLRDPDMVPFILGIGIHKLSISPESLPALQRVVESTDLGRARIFAEELLQLGRIADVEKYLEQMQP